MLTAHPTVRFQRRRHERHFSAKAEQVRTAPTPVSPLLLLLTCSYGCTSLAEDFLTEEALDADEKPSENDKTIVKQICDQLREEVKEMDRTAWLYDSPDPQAITI